MGEMFFSGREMTRPYTSGKYMADISPEELRKMSPEFTEEEKKDPFYKYYLSELPPLEPEHVKALEAGPLRPEQCYRPEECGKILLDRNADYPVNGYGVMENGVGFAAVRIHQRGITDEMIRNYRENFAHTENRLLFYKLWYPHMHLIHFEDGIVENWGWGFGRQEMRFDDFYFRNIGISKEEILEKDPDCIGFLGMGGDCIDLQRPDYPGWPTLMIQYTRQTPEGRELRVLYYTGIAFSADGSVRLQVHEDRNFTMLEMKSSFAHCAQENMNEQLLIRRFWEATA